MCAVTQKGERTVNGVRIKDILEINAIGKSILLKSVMNYPKPSLFHGRYPSEAWTRQPGLFTDWDYLFKEMVTVLLYEKKIQLGMLNPFAEVFIPKGI